MAKRILLVEDDEDSRDMLSRRLKREGFSVVTAVNGRDGIAKANQHDPHLIIMDINMPVMDGWEATKALKASSRTKHIPVVALTARSSVADFERCADVGCDSYEAKPVEFAKLLRKIKNNL